MPCSRDMEKAGLGFLFCPWLSSRLSEEALVHSFRLLSGVILLQKWNRYTVPMPVTWISNSTLCNIVIKTYNTLWKKDTLCLILLLPVCQGCLLTTDVHTNMWNSFVNIAYIQHTHSTDTYILLRTFLYVAHATSMFLALCLWWEIDFHQHLFKYLSKL